jgi:hypothetical protein
VEASRSLPQVTKPGIGLYWEPRPSPMIIAAENGFGFQCRHGVERKGPLHDQRCRSHPPRDSTDWDVGEMVLSDSNVWLHRHEKARE